MADRFSGNIQIGGKISSELLRQLNELLDIITDHDLDITGYGWFNERVDEDMKDLIAFCKDNGIALSIQWDAKYEYDSFIQYFVGDDEKTFLCTSAGQLVAEIGDMEKTPNMTIADYIKSLGIPDMPPLEVTASEYTIKSVKRTEAFLGELEDAIVRAKEINSEYSPAFGVQIENSSGETVWDSEEAAYDAQHE